ncbi:MAG: hypothetical protein ACRC1H_14110, partial [Caldilineaceae bacterium]
MTAVLDPVYNVGQEPNPEPLRTPAGSAPEATLAALDRKLDLLTRQMETLTVQVQWLSEQALDAQR